MKLNAIGRANKFGRSIKQGTAEIILESIKLKHASALYYKLNVKLILALSKFMATFLIPIQERSQYSV